MLYLSLKRPRISFGFAVCRNWNLVNYTAWCHPFHCLDNQHQQVGIVKMKALRTCLGIHEIGSGLADSHFLSSFHFFMKTSIMFVMERTLFKRDFRLGTNFYATERLTWYSCIEKMTYI